MKEQDQNFDRLKLLLKFKQHELPPPGYFNNFSGQVIARIRAGEAGRQTSFLGISWLVNFMRAFETRPGLVGSFAASLGLLLVLGVIFAEHSEQALENMPAISDPTAQLGNSLASLAAASAMPVSSDSTGIMVSTNPVTSPQSVGTLFGQPDSSSLFQTASFVPAGQ